MKDFYLIYFLISFSWQKVNELLMNKNGYFDSLSLKKVNKKFFRSQQGDVNFIILPTRKQTDKFIGVRKMDI